MVAHMKKTPPDTATPSGRQSDDSKMVPEPRFPRAAVDYIDALLQIQRMRHEREHSAAADHLGALHDRVAPPKTADIPADADGFCGTGWSDLGHRRDGMAFRWMGRIGTLLLPVDLTSGATLRIEGAAFSRRRHLRTLSFWIDDHPVEGTLSRKGFNRWIFTGTVPPLAARPYSILRLQSAGKSRLAVGVDTLVSVAVARVTVAPIEGSA